MMRDMDSYYKVPVGDGYLAIDLGDLAEDCMPRYTTIVHMETIQRKKDAVPEVGSTITYDGEKYKIVSVTNDEKFFTSRKKWSRSTAMWARNKYRRLYIKATIV